MELLCVRNLISATQITSPITNPLIPLHLRRVGTRTHHFQSLVCWKKSDDFQDFQGYAKPSRLLPAKEARVCTDYSLENITSSFKAGGVMSLYKVKLQTSSIYGSGLSDLNAGLLICVIDENGDSILQRIPASLLKDCALQSENEFTSDELLFQNGSVDEFIFEGPKLGRIEALWMSLESGQWRLGAVNLTIISPFQAPTEENDIKATQYNFEFEDILLGEGSDTAMVELRPSQVTELNGENFDSLTRNLLQPISHAKQSISNEKGMREYLDLKFSLLLYDTILVLAGSSLASFSVGESAAFAFLAGGIGGFLYLLLIQRSVDGLPAPSSATMLNETENVDKSIGNYQIPTLALATAATVIGSKSGSIFTAKDVMIGMAGFLACKVSVILAAFKPLSISSSFEDNN